MLKESGEYVFENKKKRFWMALVSVILLVALLVGMVFGVVTNGLSAKSEKKDYTVLEIKTGMTLKEIAKLLEQKGIINNEMVFEFYARYKKMTDVKAGKYRLSPHMEPEKILHILNTGKVFVDTVKITIPEGYTVEQIADILEEKALAKKDEFLAAVNHLEDYQDFRYISVIPKNSQTKYKLEGFLFPKTYEIEKGKSPKDIVLMLLKQTEKEIPEEWVNLLKARGMNLYDGITLASIVEREAKVDSERKRIAQVYYNRLAAKMKLQADATIQYALGEQKERLLYHDLEIDSPYNTYLYEGLPPGPIGNPGLKSIEAVVFPEKHNYLYYVAKNDGSGEHYFSETYEEHLKNIEKSGTQ